MVSRIARRVAPPVSACLLLAGIGPLAAQDWSSRGESGSVEAGTLIEGSFAGLLLRCAGGRGIEAVLTHNGAVFDRARAHTIVLSVDGVANVLPARAVPSERAGDDDFVLSGSGAELEPLLSALARGTSLEVSAPSGRYALGLSGSGAAIAALRGSCAAR